MKKTLSLVLAVVMTLSLLSGCGGQTTPVSSTPSAGTAEPSKSNPDYEFPELYFQLANSNPSTDTNQMHRACVLFCEKVAEKTGGRVVIEEIPDAQLGNERDYLEGVKMGTIDFCLISNSMMTNYNGANIVGELPFIYKDTETAFNYLDSDLWRDMLDTQVTPALDIVSLGWFSGGFRNILNTKRAITTADDMIGLKIRGQENRIVVAMYEALGANCTPMPVSEVVTAVQQKTVDGCDFPLGTMMSYGYPEFVEHLSMTNHLFYSFSICVSSNVWDGLDPQVQVVIREAIREAELEQRAWVIEMEAEQLEDVKSLMNISEIDRDSFVAKMDTVYDQFKEEIGGDFWNQSIALING